MNGNKTLTAVFIPGFKLTAAVTPAGAGTIDASPPGSNGLNYPTGTQIVLTATANSGFQFLRWEGDASGTNAMTLITMDADKSVTAVFTPLYTLNIAITPTGAGSVTPPTGTTYPAGTSVTLIATDNAGFLFGQWSGDASGTSATVTIIMDSDKNVTAEFVQAFTLATDVSPAGAGSVTGNDLPKYADGTVVNLVAAPVGNYAFDHWEGDTGGITPDANSADIGVPMDRNRALTAVFVPTFVLTINVTPTDKGTVSRDPDLVRYVQNGTVHLVATPVEGYGFLRWEGDTDGILTASPDVNVVMDQDKTLTAVFAELVTLTKVVLPSDAAGTIAPAGSQFALGSTIQLVATAAEDYAFDFWTGDVSGTAPSISLLMDGNKSATAHFKFIGGVTLTTAVTPDGAGAVTVSPDGPTYPVGTTLILVASPAEGYAFSYWDGDVDGVQPDINTPIISLTINTDKSLTAVFVKTFTLTTNVNPTGTGSVTLNPPGGVYPEGTVVEVTATPNSGYGFNEWTGDSTDTQAVTQITMDANKSVTANFVRVFTLMTEVSPIGAGSVAANPPGGVYKNGTMVIVTATANPGFVFDSWTGDIAGVVDPTAASIGISMGADKSLTAVFAPLYTLTIEVVGNGSVQANPPGLTYKAGTVVNLTAIPGASSTFLRWELNAGGTSPTTSVTMNEPKLVRAIFQDTFTLTVDVVGGGNVTKVPDLVAYPAGSAVQLNATPQLGWVFAGWTGSVISDASAITVTMDSNKTITANFELGPPILILTTRVEPANGGTVTALPAGPYQVGQEVQLYATANSLFQFKNWIGNVVNPNSATTSIFMNGNRTVTAVFEQITPSIDSIGVFDSQGNLRGAHAWLFGGVKAKISGSGFKNGAAVIIDGQEVSPMAVTPTAIFFVVPPAVTPFQGTDGVLHVQVQVKNQPGLPLDFSAPAGFDYWRYVVDENGLVTTAFALDMTSKASTVVDIALGVNQLGFPNGGAELTLPMPVTPVNVNVAYGVALASKDPTDVHTDLINAGPNSQPVTNAWNFAIHLYNFNTEPIGSGLNTDVLYAEIKNWAYARTANTDSAKLKFPVDDTPLKISDIRNGLSMWSIDSSYDYKSLVETPDNPVVSIYQSTIMSNESDPNATAAVTTQVDSVVARLYDLSAFALRQGIQLPTDIKTGVEVDTVFGNGKGPVTGFTQVRIKAPNGGFAWVTIAFDDYDATNPAATNYALGTFTDKAGNPLPDGQRPGQNEYQMNVFTPPYKDQSVKTDVPVDIIIYLNGDLTTPAVVLSNGFIYQPVSKCDIGLILALLGLGAALIGLAAGGHDDNGGGGPCFIATAAYGTPMAAQIDTLRTFRDAYLLDSTVGTAFVDTYYRISPAVAEVVAKSPVLAAGVRIILIPMIFLAKIVMAKPLLTLTMLALAIIALRMRKRIRSRA
jgi:uncharacterized repeat protein (TIGR02543 family)